MLQNWQIAKMLSAGYANQSYLVVSKLGRRTMKAKEILEETKSKDFLSILFIEVGETAQVFSNEIKRLS